MHLKNLATWQNVKNINVTGFKYTHTFSNHM